MTLRQYMKTHGLTDGQIAKMLGKDCIAVSRYRRGEVTPPDDVIWDFQRITRWAVCFEDWEAAHDRP